METKRKICFKGKPCKYQFCMGRFCICTAHWLCYVSQYNNYKETYQEKNLILTKIGSLTYKQNSGADLGSDHGNLHRTAACLLISQLS
jgi:hypothetical protein